MAKCALEIQNAEATVAFIVFEPEVSDATCNGARIEQTPARTLVLLSVEY